MNQDFIYLDNNATTPLDPRVLEAMMPYLTDLFGNASSGHRMGKQIKSAVDRARGQMGDLINANPEDIIYTAGSTEAINIALRGLPHVRPGHNHHIITVTTEHPAVLDTCKYLESIGVDVTYLSVNKEGLIDFDELKSAFRENTVLVCVMMINNETGVAQEITGIAEIAHEHGALFMTDATQAVGKVTIDVTEEEIDILAFSAHKFYGPKGIGGLYINPRLKLNPLVFGGGHERGLRSGTLNVPGIMGLGAAAKLAGQQMLEDQARVGALRQTLEEGLLMIEGAKVNGHLLQRSYNTTNLRFESVDNEALMLHLKNICVSNGSACHSFTMEPSHVLLSMGLTKEEANSSIRFSLGRFNTREEIEITIDAVKTAINSLKAFCI